MSHDQFSSSDSVRNARPLRQVRSVDFDEPLRLERGGQLPRVSVAYETYGQLRPDGGNAVLVCHALSGDSHVARHDAADDPGWWDVVVGPGKPIDTERYFVICPNVLGGCRGTTGPNSVNPATGQPYGADFPVITVGDIVQVQRRLMDRLGIERLLAAVGGSLGGHMVLDWATRFPDRLAGAVAIATAARLTSQALAFDVVGRNAILRDPEYQAGQYYADGSGPTVGLALARMLGHITYLSREAMTEKFDARRLEPHDVRTQFETKFAVGSYLAHQGDRFVDRFDANSYLTLTMAIDLFDLGATPERLAETLGRSRCRWLVESFSTDWLFPAFQSREIVDALIALGKPVSYCNVASPCGHDAFLLPNELAIYGELLRGFLANLDEKVGGRWNMVGGDPHIPPTTYHLPSSPHIPPTTYHLPSSTYHLPSSSIFHDRRLDYDSILSLIPPGASVLDLGCGNGALLARLRQSGHARIMGIELDERAILDCVRQGLDVVQTDLNQGLPALADGQFDYVVLSQTLQSVMDVERLLAEMIRVGRQGIVSFPNLAYKHHRAQLADEGRAPRLGVSQGIEWYNTPNVRFFSIADFELFCRDRAIRIDQRTALDTQSDRVVCDDPNRNADVAIFVVSR